MRDIIMEVTEQTFFDKIESFQHVHHLIIQGTNYQFGQQLAQLAIERARV